MIKKLNIVFLTLCLFFATTESAFASGMSRQYIPPIGSDYLQEKLSYQLYISPGVSKVKITQFAPKESDGTKEVIEEVIWDVKPNSFIWVDMFCKGDTSFQYWNGSRWVDTHTRAETNQLAKGTCSSSGNVKPSDFNEDENRYASDTFGGTKNPLSNPPTADGSGGTGDSGYIGIGNEPGSGGDGGDGGNGGNNDGGNAGNNDDGDCGCNIFDLPGWDEHMSKLDEIANRIPPAPNWSQVADTFRNTIVPSMVNEMGNLLGQAPSAPSPPPQLPSVSDRGLSNQTPSMPDVPGLGNAGFNAGKIKNEAPVIQERQDPTGGFDLITNPLDSLPEAPSPQEIIPGKTDPGEWGEHKPSVPDNPFPMPSESTGQPDLSDTPIPGDNEATPPTPGGDTGSAPIPGGDYGPPPTTDSNLPGMKDYKPSPDAPDGSGGDIRW